jgi:hypothetical protein
MKIAVLNVMVFIILLAACDRKKPPADTPRPEAPTCGPVDTGGNCIPTGQATVTKIVFIGMAEACPCTKRSIDGTWKALNQANSSAGVPVERIHIDTEEQKVEPYKSLRPMDTVPALYFLDGKGALVEMLQGEVTSAEIAKVLGPTGTAK